MKCITLSLFFLIVLIDFINGNEISSYIVENDLGYEVTKSSVNNHFEGKQTKIKYCVSNSFNSSKIDRAFNELQNKTCFKFIKVDDHSDSNTIQVKYSKYCNVDITSELGKFFIVINANNDCEYYLYLQKLILKAITLKRQLFELIQRYIFKNPEYLLVNNRLYLSTYKYCKVDKKSKNLLILTHPFHHNLNLMISDYSSNYFYLKTEHEDITFEDIKNINDKFCQNSCKEKKKLKCHNGGFRNPNDCSTCLCPKFYTKANCEKFVEPKNHKSCGKYLIKSHSKKHNKTLDFGSECLHKIETSKEHFIELTIIPQFLLKYSCKKVPFLEFWFSDKQSTRSIYPCGTIKKFSINCTSNTVHLFHTKIDDFFSFQLSYRSVKI